MDGSGFEAFKHRSNHQTNQNKKTTITNKEKTKQTIHNSCRSRFGGRGMWRNMFWMKKKVFSEKGGGIQWMRDSVWISTGKAFQWRGLGHSVNRRSLQIEKLLSSSPSPKSALITASKQTKTQSYIITWQERGNKMREPTNTTLRTRTTTKTSTLTTAQPTMKGSLGNDRTPWAWTQIHDAQTNSITSGACHRGTTSWQTSRHQSPTWQCTPLGRCDYCKIPERPGSKFQLDNTRIRHSKSTKPPFSFFPSEFQGQPSDGEKGGWVHLVFGYSRQAYCTWVLPGEQQEHCHSKCVGSYGVCLQISCQKCWRCPPSPTQTLR